MYSKTGAVTKMVTHFSKLIRKTVLIRKTAMLRSWNWSRLALVLATTCLLLTAPVCLLAQEDEEEPVVVEGRNQRVMWTDETIDQWIFGSGRNAQQARKRLETQLTLRIDELDRACQLTEEQKKKLQLAGQGDIKRLYDDTAIIRQKFDKLRNDQNAINQIFQEIQPLQARISAGIFRAESFYQKSVLKILGAEQAAKMAQLDLDRRIFRYHANILLTLTVVDAGVPLRDEQRQKLIKLLQEETKPPKRFGQYDSYVVMLQMSKLPPEKIKAILDETQWKAMQGQFQQAKGLELYLQQNGILDQVPEKVSPAAKLLQQLLPKKKTAAVDN
jgi:hypothetical protein